MKNESIKLKNSKYIEAAYEAIYWWNRDEFYYHQYFSRILEIWKDKDLFEIFKAKIFEIFLREYSVRRNAPAGLTGINDFLNHLGESNFFEEVINGNISIIDDASQSLLKNGITKKNTRSLLSKAAFLTNPIDYSLMDTLAKNALWRIVKPRKITLKKELDKYSNFIKIVDYAIEENQVDFEECSSILRKFPKTEAYKFFEKNPVAFKRRIFDKYLWIEDQKKSKNKNYRKINYSKYEKFNKLNNES